MGDAFAGMVSALVDNLDRRLRVHGLREYAIQPDWGTLEQAFVRIGIRSLAGLGARFTLTVFDQGGLILSLEDVAEPVEEGLADELGPIADRVADAARYGVVWTGFPLRRSSVWVAPTVPRNDDQLSAALGKGYARYDPPWPS